MKNQCPCGQQLPFEACCQKYINGENAPTPETLMRSRYSAYVMSEVDYIANTMQGEPLKDFDKSDTKAWLNDVKWLGLKVIQAKQKSDKLGYVSFEARYHYQGKDLAICEKSEFHKIDNKWVYVGGKALNPNKTW
ncbi:MAG: YchJ family protein [Candidatus Berkiella sp.]